MRYIWIFIIFLASSMMLKAQSSNVDAAFDQGGFFNQLWLGGNVILGYSGGSGDSYFQFGLTPMVGYKLTENFSVGPRLGFTYTNIKGTAADENGELSNRAANLTEYTGGIFARYKFFEQFFVHLEGEYRSAELPFGRSGFLAYDSDKGEVLTYRDTEFNPIIGAGYNSSGGGLWGYEILVLYRTNIAEDDPRSPFDIRVGFTYNF